MSTEALSRCADTLPHAEIVWERIAGVPKSMTAIKQCNFNDGTALRG